MSGSKTDSHIEIIKREKGFVTVSIDVETRDFIYENYKEDLEFSKNKQKLEEEAEVSLSSGYGLVI